MVRPETKCRKGVVAEITVGAEQPANRVALVRGDAAGPEESGPHSSGNADAERIRAANQRDGPSARRAGIHPAIFRGAVRRRSGKPRTAAKAARPDSGRSPKPLAGYFDKIASSTDQLRNRRAAVIWLKRWVQTTRVL